ncbi:MAG: LamG domain-containing protein [Bacteroidales bacterium]|nr:LamG domain-containing protein [Bacteroidales bacterium]
MKTIGKALLALSFAASLLLCTSCDFEYNNDVTIGFDDESGDYLSGQLARYTFDNADGSDASGNGRVASFYGEPNFIQGQRGSGVFLNAMREEYMNIPYALFKDRHEWTVSFWIKDFGVGNIFAAQNTNPNEYLDAIYTDYPLLWAGDEGRLILKNAPGEPYNGDGHPFSYSYTSVQADGSWHHVVVALKESKVPNSYKEYKGMARLYVDGSMRDQINFNYNQDWDDDCSKVVFGGDKDGGYPYKSSLKLDEVRFYDRALGNAAVAALYSFESN